MRVLQVWDYEYPWDVRIEKFCRALTGADHHVHLVARNRAGAVPEERMEECTVHRMAPLRALGAKLDAASQFPAFFNPRWLTLINRTARTQGVDVIIVRDIPLALTAIHVARRLRIPVVLDMAENYPAMIRDLWTTRSTKFGDVVVRNPRVVEAVERAVLRSVDHVFVVVEESRNRLVELGIHEGKISIVGNTPPLERLSRFEALRSGQSTRDTRGSGLRLSYLGLMEEARGVGLVIEAVALARKRGVDVHLDLVGDGRALGAFRDRASALGLSSEVVRFRGFVPYNEALSELVQADAGLVPHFANESWQTTIPNKLFDYMSLGLPVIASDVTPVARILQETGAGRLFRDRDVEDLTEVFVSLQSLKDQGRLAAMGFAGQTAIRSKYHWERDAEQLMLSLDRLVTGRLVKPL